MKRTLVLDVVGLTPAMLGEHAPALTALAKAGAARPIQPVLPAVTCSVQSTFVTGRLPREHGCVANGWYYRDTAEVHLWKQANQLVTGDKVWDEAKRRDPAFTSAKICWWYAMYATNDWIVTPRPMYPADGRKLPDVWTHPSDLRGSLQSQLGQFPLFEFWGPRAGIAASKWIATAAIDVWRTRKPTLALVYLPHLDYVLQKEGPNGPSVNKELRAIDAVCGDLIEIAHKDGANAIVLSEYGITEVSGAVMINQVLRDAGLIAVRDEVGLEVLDAAASEAFAVVDHQVAHVYVKRAERVTEVAALLAAVPGIERVLDETGKREHGLDHPRSGELVAIAAPDKWFAYYYWKDPARAPDFARTVDIHRKPGYDPVELFLGTSPAYVAWKLAQRKLGLRALLDVIPLDPSLVKGSHGRLPDSTDHGPVAIASDAALLPGGGISATHVRDLILRSVFG